AARDEKPRSDLSMATPCHVPGISSNRSRASSRTGFNSAPDAFNGRTGVAAERPGVSGWRSCRAGVVQVSDRDSNRTVVLHLAPMAVRLRFREFGPSRDSGINLACRHFSIHYIRPLVNYNGSRPT